MLTPKTFLIMVSGILAFAYVTQSFMPTPYMLVKQVDNVAMSVLEMMHPQAREACGRDLSTDC